MNKSKPRQAVRHFLQSLMVLVTLGFVLLAKPGVAHAEDIVIFRGTLTTHEVPCSTLCTEGTMAGDIVGTLSFVMTSMTATSNPDVFKYTGTNTITTATGTLSGTDYGLWNVATGEFVDYTTFTTRTGSFAQYDSGKLVITGTFNVETGGQSNWVAAFED